MKYFYILFLIWAACLHAQGQVTPDNPVTANVNMQQLSELGTRMTATPLSFDNRYEGVKGSPYVFDEWQNARIHINADQVVTDPVKLNIDGQKNVAIVRLPTEILGLGNEKFMAIEILEGERKVRYETIEKSKLDGKGEGRVLVEVCADGSQYGLYKLPVILFIKANYQGAYSPDVRYDEYVPSPVYYLRVGKKFEKVKLKKKAIQKVIPEIRRMPAWKGTELNEQKLVELITGMGQRK